MSTRPLTGTLRKERWDTADAIFWRPPRRGRCEPFTPDDADALRADLAANQRLNLLEANR